MLTKRAFELENKPASASKKGCFRVLKWRESIDYDFQFLYSMNKRSQLASVSVTQKVNWQFENLRSTAERTQNVSKRSFIASPPDILR